LHCPFCNSDESKVVDSRDSEAGDAIRRRRECLACERRYTTYERIEEVPLVVAKSDGRQELFTRQKVLNGLLRACEKRDIPLDRLERAIDDIENDLRDIDKVAYIRFASVYRQFDDIEEFQQELAQLELSGAEPLPGEEPLPGIDADELYADETIFTTPRQAVATQGGTGHD